MSRRHVDVLVPVPDHQLRADIDFLVASPGERQAVTAGGVVDSAELAGVGEVFSLRSSTRDSYKDVSGVLK